jgi:hypothetical protein
MVAAEDADADDRDRNWFLGWQEKFSMAGCREEIVNVNEGKSIWRACALEMLVGRAAPLKRAPGLKPVFFRCDVRGPGRAALPGRGNRSRRQVKSTPGVR